MNYYERENRASVGEVNLREPRPITDWAAAVYRAVYINYRTLVGSPVNHGLCY